MPATPPNWPPTPDELHPRPLTDKERHRWRHEWTGPVGDKPLPKVLPEPVDGGVLFRLKLLVYLALAVAIVYLLLRGVGG